MCEALEGLTIEVEGVPARFSIDIDDGLNTCLLIDDRYWEYAHIS